MKTKTKAKTKANKSESRPPDDMTAVLWTQDRKAEREGISRRLQDLSDLIREDTSAIRGEERRERLLSVLDDARREVRGLPDTVDPERAVMAAIPFVVALQPFNREGVAAVKEWVQDGVAEVLGLVEAYVNRRPDYYGEAKESIPSPGGQAEAKDVPSTPEGLRSLILKAGGVEEQKTARCQALLAMKLRAEKESFTVDRGAVASCFGFTVKELSALERTMFDGKGKRPKITRPGENNGWNKVETESLFQFQDGGQDIKRLVGKLDLSHFTK